MDNKRQHGDPGQGRRTPGGPAPGSTSGDPGIVGEPSEGASRAATREHLLVTFIECVARFGYHHTRIEDLCRDVGVSKREFYCWFGRKEPCYLMVFNTYGHQVIARAQRAYEAADGPWETQLRAALVATTSELAAHPLMVRFLLEFPHVEHGSDALWGLVTRSQRIYLTDDVRQCAPPVPSEALEGIASSVVVQPMLRYVQEGKLDRLPELVPWIVYYLTLTVFGPERAAEQYPASA